MGTVAGNEVDQATKDVPAGPRARDLHVDLVVIGSGTGMAAALAAHEAGLSVVVVEKSPYVGGSTARSGGAFWVPNNPVLERDGAEDSQERAHTYLDAVVGKEADSQRWGAFLDHGPDAVAMLERLTPLSFFWAKGYSDYHPERPGGSPEGRSCESKPFNARVLGKERKRLRPGYLSAPIPMPVTGADYRWMNLIKKKPIAGGRRVMKRALQGIGGLALGREYVAGGQAIAAGLFAGLIEAGIPVWTRTSLVDLVTDGGRVVGALVEQDGQQYQITASKGVIIATGGFDHDMSMRQSFQSPILTEDLSLGADSNTGDGITIGRSAGADLAFMREAWWFPAISPLPGEQPLVMLAERSLPGSLIVNGRGERFINESTDYMSFGQKVLSLADKGEGPGDMWFVFDKEYRSSYVFGGTLMPGMKIPTAWYEAGIAVRGSRPTELAEAMGVSADALTSTLRRFNDLAKNGKDEDFGRGDSAYDRYYGDPTHLPNACLRPLHGDLFAVRMVLSDLGTCGGLKADHRGRVLSTSGEVIDGLYAIGNAAGNAFGDRYPGAGATIGAGIVFGYLAARDASQGGVS